MKTSLSAEFFRAENIPDGIRKFNQALIEKGASASPFHQLLYLPVPEFRDLYVSTPTLSSPTQRFISGPDGVEIGLRLFTPPCIQGVFLFIHGGGWVAGGAALQDEFLDFIAREVNLAIVSVEYRLAPEYPHPIPLDDCEMAAVWLIEEGKKEFGTDRFFIGGSSAGAHLAVLTLLRLKVKNLLPSFKAACLINGLYDLQMTPSARNWGKSELILSTPIIKKCIDYYLPTNMNRSDPTISPLYADLTGMPRALFLSGTADPLLDDTLFMFMRWISSGSEAELALFPGGIHGFASTTMMTPQTEQGRKRIVEFFHDALSNPGFY